VLTRGWTGGGEGGYLRGGREERGIPVPVKKVVEDSRDGRKDEIGGGIRGKEDTRVRAWSKEAWSPRCGNG